MTDGQGNPVWRLDIATQHVSRDSVVQSAPMLRETVRAINWWGGPGVIWFAAVLWLGGRAIGRHAWAKAGLRGAEALAVASALSGIAKGLAGRARPFVTPGEPWHWDFNHGWTDARYFSMPSGHTTATVAFAIGVALATAGWRTGQRVAMAGSLGASGILVALARMVADQHWLTDVLVALMLGSCTSVLLAWLHRRRPATRYDRFMLGKAHLGALLLILVARPTTAEAQRISELAPTRRTSGMLQARPETPPPRPQGAAVVHGAAFTKADALALGLATASGAVVVGWDRAIADRVRGSRLQDDAFTRGVMDGAGAFGDPGTIVLSAGLWATGKLSGNRNWQLIGLRTVEAVVLAGSSAGVLKGISGRARPDEAPTLPRSFVMGRGVGDRSEFQSFPSGHATAAFAFAAAVNAEWARLAPQRPRWVAQALWGIATLSAASRVYRDRHWMSDVIVGSAIGVVGGRAVVRWHGDGPESR